jgi:hypothetical protein
MRKKHSNRLELDKDLLYDLYVNKGYSLKELANEVFYCSHPTIINYMKAYGIERRVTGRRKGSKNKAKKVKEDV